MVHSPMPVGAMPRAWIMRRGGEESSAVQGMGCLRGRAPHMTVGMEVYAVVQASEVMIATA